ncbi:MAG: 6-phosphofructokinase [bacterium]|nr:6-phosphofructokinase [bacterium]MCS7310196.1 6-phosphofructokinase [Armatimonadota bacterium]MDW8104575.1 6-phosphofructokinase [Armatimonadota bacterium]
MKRIGVLTSGGDASGMNPALRAVVRTAIVNGLEVIGIERGYEGLLNGWLRPMELSSVGGIINRGGTILRTARSERFKTEEGLQQASRILHDNHIDGLIVIGGDGSFRGAHRLQEVSGVPVIGIPATIDNDIGGTEYTLGYDTALQVAMDAIDKIRDTADSFERIFVIEVMGRSRGFIAAAVGLAGGAEAVLIPEVPFDLVQVCEKLKKGIARGKRSAIIVTAEGAASAHDVATFVEMYLREETRATVLGYTQRGGSPTATDRIMGARFGALAVELLLRGQSRMMTAWQRGELVSVPLSATWEQPRELDTSLLKLNEVLAS